MSATATETGTAATSATIDELFHKATPSYETALKVGIQLQEESLNLWKDLLTMLDSTEEFQAKLVSVTADAFRQARKRMEEFVEKLSRTSMQTIDLFEKNKTEPEQPEKICKTGLGFGAQKVRRHLEEDYAQLFQAWLSRQRTARTLGEL